MRILLATDGSASTIRTTWVSAPDERVFCIARGMDVDLATCLECEHLVCAPLEADRRYVICDAYEPRVPDDMGQGDR